MAKCAKCGRPAGINLSLCAACDDDRAATNQAEQSHIVAERERNRLRVAEGRREEIEKHVAQVRERIERAGYVCLFRSVYLPVDSVVMEERLAETFDIAPLHSLGLMGWEVITSVPRTVGLGAANTTVGATVGRTFGGGLGGNIAGVHLILQKRLVGPLTDDLDAEIRANVDHYLASPAKLPNRYL